MRNGNLRKASGGNVDDDAGLGSDLPDFDERFGICGFEGETGPLLDTDTILVGEEVSHSDGEFVRIAASSNVAETSSSASMISRDGFYIGIP